MRLKAEGLTKEFGDLTAVDSLSFTLGEGEIWGFIGPNGAGKTTTLRMLATVENPTAGDAYLNGYSVVKDAHEVRPLIGFMPDFTGSYPDMLVREYLDFFARAYGLDLQSRQSSVNEIVDFMEIGPLMDKRVSSLSRGMMQRISLGRALVHDPDLLLLDEPAAGLDPQARKELRELLRVLATEDKTILISSHILSELEGLVDKVVIISEGKLVYCGAPEERHEQADRKFALTIKIMGDLRQSARILLESPPVEDVKALEPDVLTVKMSGGREAIASLVERLVQEKQLPYQVMTKGKLLEEMFLEVTGREKDAVED
jgi:ABC-2 type transport system ATP-binding protein